MILRKSRFVHQLPVGADRVLLVHAVSHLRLPVDAGVARLVEQFERPRSLPDDFDDLVKLMSIRCLERRQDFPRIACCADDEHAALQRSSNHSAARWSKTYATTQRSIITR
jgi:hypothetical protein